MPASIKGPWGGTIGGAGFLLRVNTQRGATFLGSAELQTESGSWKRYKVTGSLDQTTGAVYFADMAQQVVFNGKAKTSSMSGSATVAGAKKQWNVSR